MLTPLADRWIAVRNTTKPSPNTVAARQRDLAVIAEHLADLLGRHRAEGAEDGTHVPALDGTSARTSSTSASRSCRRTRPARHR